MDDGKDTLESRSDEKQRDRVSIVVLSIVHDWRFRSLLRLRDVVFIDVNQYQVWHDV